MIVRVGHLYPEYLNIYADRGNIAVFERRAAARGHELRVEPITTGTPLVPGRHDLLYVGGGQDREQAMIAPDLAAHGGGAARGGRSRGCAPRRLRRLPAARSRATADGTVRGSKAQPSSRTRRSRARPA